MPMPNDLNQCQKILRIRKDVSMSVDSRIVWFLLKQGMPNET
jgi:hypothetical protein